MRCKLYSAFLFGLSVVLAAPPALAGYAAVEAENINYDIGATSLAQHCVTTLHDAEETLNKLLSHPLHGATFANFMLPFENAQSDASDALLADQLLGSVSSDRSTRDASDVCQSETDHMISRIVSRPELSALLHAVAQSKTAHTIADAKLVDLWTAQADRAGARLAPQQHQLYLSLTHRLDDLQSAFIANLSNIAATVTVTEAQTLGLPPDFLRSAVHNGATGTYTINVDESTADRFMRNARSESARRAFYTVYADRGYPENEPILREVLSIRLRLAALLGYRDWASYVLADRMAQTPQRVRGFLDGLDAALVPVAQRQAARLARLKAIEEHTKTAVLANWDSAYYDEQLRRTEYAVDDDAVRRYFPVAHVIPAVLHIYAHMLGIGFTPVVPVHAWANDVQQFTVADADGRFIGTLYLDLYPRPGKYTHFASFPLLPQRRNPDGTFRPPIDAIIGNWSRPAPGEPATLSHDEVQTFFHEFGHAMAALLTTAPYETLSEGFRTDFVEAPSQMLENFVWTPGILKELSANVADGAPLPDDLIAKLIAARHVDDALFNTQQILYADADLAFHSSNLEIDPALRWQQIAKRTTPLVPPPFVHPEAAFAHIMGGYDAGYYGYLWSRVYAQDMFTAFEDAGVESTEVGTRYRRTILEPARTLEPDTEVRAFLGRPVNPEAFYRDLGIRIHSPGLP